MNIEEIINFEKNNVNCTTVNIYRLIYSVSDTIIDRKNRVMEYCFFCANYKKQHKEERHIPDFDLQMNKSFVQYLKNTYVNNK